MQIELKEKELWIKLPENLYSESVLYKCFYWYGKDYSVSISKEKNGYFHIALEPKQNHLNEEGWAKVIQKIKQDLIDFKLRAIVNQETKTIRELITAKAFAYYEINNAPSSNVSDPVGFHPNETNLYE